MSSSPLSYSLGADDISKIVDALLPKLAPLFPGLSNEEQYVLLHTEVLNLSQGKTFTNKDDLDTLVNNIVNGILNGDNSAVTPSSVCANAGASGCVEANVSYPDAALGTSPDGFAAVAGGAEWETF